jgi:hypothetical protein
LLAEKLIENFSARWPSVTVACDPATHASECRSQKCWPALSIKRIERVGAKNK